MYLCTSKNSTKFWKSLTHWPLNQDTDFFSEFETFFSIARNSIFSQFGLMSPENQTGLHDNFYHQCIFEQKKFPFNFDAFVTQITTDAYGQHNNVFTQLAKK